MIELHKEYYEIIIIDIILGTIPLVVSESWNLFSNWKAYFLLTKIRRYKASFFPSWSSSARCSTEQQRVRRRNEWKDRLKLAIMAKQIWDISTQQKSVQIIACFQFSSVQWLSCVRLCDPQGPQHARPPCLSPIPGVYPRATVHGVAKVSDRT